MEIHRLEKIPVSLPEQAVMARLGKNRRLARIPDGQRRKIENALRAGFELCSPTAAWRRLEIIENDGEKVVLNENIVLKSVKLCRLLTDSHAVLLFAATVGAEIVDAAATAAAVGNGVDALVYDAVGSEIADNCMNWLQDYLGQSLKRLQEKFTKRRFSAGYGDFKLENQLIMFNLLRLEKMGIAITRDYILIPEKTVTAIAGIEKLSLNRNHNREP